jgi:hypothetical protein
MTYPTKLHEALATLKAGRAIIADPNVWTDGALGRDIATGHEWEPNESCFDAPQVCSWGALSKVKNVPADKLGYQDFRNLDCAANFLQAVANSEFDGRSIVDVNDDKGHEATVAMWDMAIVNCEKAIQEWEAGKHIEPELPI